MKSCNKAYTRKLEKDSQRLVMRRFLILQSPPQRQPSGFTPALKRNKKTDHQNKQRNVESPHKCLPDNEVAVVAEKIERAMVKKLQIFFKFFDLELEAHHFFGFSI
jgi:hypothetical protein